MSLLDRSVSLFHRVDRPGEKINDITVRQALNMIREGRFAAGIERVRSSSSPKARARAKRALPFVTFSGTFARRCNDALVQHSGLVSLDFDDLDDVLRARAEVVSNPHTLAVFVSPSGNGLKALVPVLCPTDDETEATLPGCDFDHKRAFAAVVEEYGLDGLDAACSDVSRACFVSYDPDLVVRPEAQPVVVTTDGTQDFTSPARAALSHGVPRTLDEVIPHGVQHHTLVSIAGTLRRRGLIEEEITACLLQVNKRCEKPGTNTAIRRIAKSVMRYAPSDAPTGPPANEAPMLPWLPFPVDSLPEPVAAYVRAYAAALGADPAFIAVPVLAALSAAVGNSHRVRLKRSWEEPGALWGVVVADSGSGKSPALQAALEPVFGLEREAKETHEQERELYEAEKREYDALTKKQRGAKPPPELATRRRYRVGDTTVESLVFVHEQNPRGLLLARDELAGWLGSFDRYARGESDMQVWIEMHGGRPVTIDRKSAEQPVLFLESPNVSAAGTIQPDVLRRQLTPLHLSSGFAARLLLAEPPERPKRWTDADVTPDVSAAYHRLIWGLYTLPYAPDSGPAVVGLTPEAQAAFVAFVNENGAKQHALPSGPLRAALSKHEALAARLALHLHLADAVASGGGSVGAIGPVSAYAMGQAVHLARWFRYETARLYQRYGIEEQAVDRDERLAAELPETFGWRDVAETWGIEKAGAYKAIDRLQNKRLAEDAGHGSFRRTFPEERPGRRVDFGDFPSADGTIVSKVYQSPHPLSEGSPPERPLPHPSGDGEAGLPPADSAEPWAPWEEEDERGLSL